MTHHLTLLAMPLDIIRRILLPDGWHPALEVELDGSDAAAGPIVSWRELRDSGKSVILNARESAIIAVEGAVGRS